MKKPKIVATHIAPPIPVRGYDWIAVDDNTYDGSGPVGVGRTQQEAIDDLLAQLEEAA